MERSRDSGIDLLRILAALMVIGTHVMMHGGIMDVAWRQGENALGAGALQSLCMSSVNCFALISGYVLSTSRFRLVRILRLWSVVLFYALLFTAVRLAVEPAAVSKRELISAVFPITFKRLWYVSAYFGLFFLTPFINRLLRSLNRAQHLALSLVLLFLFSALATVSFSDTFGINDRGHNTMWLAVLYIVGAYVRMHARPWSRRTGALMLVGSIAAAVLVKLAASWLAVRIFGRLPVRQMFFRDISPLIVLIALSLFQLCRGFFPKRDGAQVWIKRIASTTLGVYVIHMQPMLWETWRRAFEPIAHAHPLAFPFLAAAAILALFVCCSALDMLRARLFKRMHIERALLFVERRALWAWNLLFCRAQRYL